MTGYIKGRTNFLMAYTSSKQFWFYKPITVNSSSKHVYPQNYPPWPAILLRSENTRHWWAFAPRLLTTKQRTCTWLNLIPSTQESRNQHMIWNKTLDSSGSLMTIYKAKMARHIYSVQLCQLCALEVIKRGVKFVEHICHISDSKKSQQRACSAMAANKERWFSQTVRGERGKAIGIYRNKANSEKPK